MMGDVPLRWLVCKSCNGDKCVWCLHRGVVVDTSNMDEVASYFESSRKIYLANFHDVDRGATV